MDRFLTSKQSQLTNSQWQRLLHHITVEVLALKGGGRDVLEVCNGRKEGDAPRIANVTIDVQDGVPTLKYEGDANQETILSAIETVMSEPVSEKSLQDELRIATDSTAEPQHYPKWMAFGLGDPIMKLAVRCYIHERRAHELTDCRS